MKKINVTSFHHIAVRTMPDGTLAPVIGQATYINNSEEALCENESSLDTALDNLIESNTVMDDQITEERRKILLERLHSIRSLLDSKIEKATALPEWKPMIDSKRKASI